MYNVSLCRSDDYEFAVQRKCHVEPIFSSNASGPNVRSQAVRVSKCASGVDTGSLLRSLFVKSSRIQYFVACRRIFRSHRAGTAYTSSASIC